MDNVATGSEDPKARELRAAADSLAIAAKVVAGLASDAASSAMASVPVVLRVTQIAQMLDLGERAVRNMMDRGELPWVRLGRQRVVPLQLWLDRLAEQANANDTRGTW